MTARRHLVLGGARSGKTRFALDTAAALAAARAAHVYYAATAEARDEEMVDRIARHRAERPSSWRTVEAPRSLAQALRTVPADAVVVVDCLTLWLSNALLADFQDAQPLAPLPTWSAERDDFIDYLQRTPAELVLVSNEVGWGAVPMAPVARRFQDEQGRLNQTVAQLCDEVTLVTAGLPMVLKRVSANRLTQ
jgi:adenosylcobinamide kinase / adenosylcobinamide-phosphate guanylyltransferase